MYNFYLTYKRGFQNRIATTTWPEVNITYMYNLNTILNAGLGGVNSYNAGVFASVGWPLVFSVASNNVLGAILNVKTGFDASVSMVLNF